MSVHGSSIQHNVLSPYGARELGAGPAGAAGPRRRGWTLSAWLDLVGAGSRLLRVPEGPPRCALGVPGCARRTARF